LRANQTMHEYILWQRLRGRQFEGLKFFRQYGVGPFILDFYCPELRLAIELDGSGHLKEEVIKYDKKRTAYLQKEEIQVIRYYNTEVIEDVNAVLESILKEVKQLKSVK